MVSASINLIMVVILPITFYLLHQWPKPKVDVIEASRVGILRRFAAFYIDISVAMIGVLPFVIMPTLLVEYLNTGQWAWAFERDFFRVSDILTVAIMLIGFWCIYFYSRWHFKRGKQTLGQHLLNFNLTPMEPHPIFSARVLVAWVNAAWWPIWPWTIMKKKQDYWWDTSSKIKARRVRKL